MEIEAFLPYTSSVVIPIILLFSYLSLVKVDASGVRFQDTNEKSMFMTIAEAVMSTCMPNLQWVEEARTILGF